MKVAFLTARLPYPPNAGGPTRTFHLLKEISQVHDITLSTTTEGRSDEGALVTLQEVIPRVSGRAVRVESEKPWGRYVRAIRNPIDSLPYTWARYRNQRLRAHVWQTLRESRYDVVHCDHVQVAHALDGLETPPRLLNAHNVESVLVRRVAERARPAWRRMVIRWQAAKTLEAERRAYRLFDRCLAVSEEDAAAMKRMAPGTAVSVVPNGMDLTHFRPHAGPGAPNVMVFTGAMDGLPNVDGVTFFVREILPRIKQRDPDAQFWVVGRNPPSLLVHRLAGDSVRFTGSVNDVRPYLVQARVVVVPLRIGGGTRLKILEAWALGKAVVSTAIGAEGLPAENGKNIALADTPEGFAERAVTLLNDTEAGEQLGAAGRWVVEDHFAWDCVAQALLEAYEATRAGGREEEPWRTHWAGSSQKP